MQMQEEQVINFKLQTYTWIYKSFSKNGESDEWNTISIKNQ